MGLGQQPCEWLSNSTSPHRYYHLDRCFKNRMGGNLPGDIHWGPLGCGRGEGAHQCLGVTSSNTSPAGILTTSAPGTKTCSLADRQHHSGGIHKQEGGYTLPCSHSPSPGTMGSGPGCGSIPDSTAHSRHSEYSSRYSFQADRDPNRMDLRQENLPIHLSEVLQTRSGSLCIPLKSSSAPVCFEVPGSGSTSCRRLSPGLEQVDLSNPPPCRSSSSDLEKDQSRPGNCSLNCTELDRATMVPGAPSDACGSTSTASPAPILAVPPISTCSSTPPVAITPPSRLAPIRDRYKATGFSKEVVDILLASWATATQKRYAGPWKAWVRWCSQRSVCPISAPVADVLAFLASLVTQKDLEYRTIALYKSAISQAHNPIGSTQLGSLPVVSRFMKGVFKNKPPKPKYCSTWKVGTALSFLGTLEPLQKLTLRQLSYKTILLLALTSAARAHELSALDLACSLRKEGSWEFSLPTHVKTSRPGHPARKMFLPSFPDNPNICVVRTLAAYVERTRDLRKSSQLLVSLIAPHKAISSQSVSRWLTRALRMAGIELGYSGHSTRGASTSAAAAGGLSVDLILEAADWASAQTFERFYHREASRAAFARAVLNSVNSS